MKQFFLLFVVTALLLLPLTQLNAQANGDYRSNTTAGNWSAAATWMTYDGSNWNAATQAPNGAQVIIIRSTDSVFIDIQVSVSDTLKNQGKLGGTGSLTIASGGVYQHDEQNGSLPQCTWATGSTCLVTGYVTGSKPNNANQNFYNFTWNCPAQTGNTDLAMTGNIIGGNFTVMSTGTARVYLTSPTPYIQGHPITINGNVIVTGGTFASNGSGSMDTIEVITMGDIILTGGVFSVSRGSAPDVTWKLYGNFLASNADLRNSGELHVNTLELVGAKYHLISLTNVTYAGGGGSYFTIQVDSGSTADLGTSVISSLNDGSFIVRPGATLVCADPAGINGNIQCTGNRGGGNVFSTLANYKFNASVAQVTGTLLPNPVNQLIIDDAAGVTLSATCLVTDTLHLPTGILYTGSNIVAANGVVQRGSGYIAGTLEKTFSATGSKDFEVGTANGYSPVTVNVTGATGDMNISAVQGAEPHVANALQTIGRYWIISVTGITQADLTFHYMAADVNGVESAYQVGRYDGATFNLLPTTVDTINHTASVTGVTAFSNWTLGEPLGLPVKESKTLIPKKYFVDRSYPNPFNPSTTIEYGVPKFSWISVKVYNLLGQEVATLFEGYQNPGVHALRFDGSNLGSGIYFCRFESGRFVDVQRLLLIK